MSKTSETENTGPDSPAGAFTGSTPPVHRKETGLSSLHARILSMRLHHAHCSRCGSILDAPRVNPETGKPGRKCGDCVRWQQLAPRAPANSAGPPLAAPSR